MLSGLVLAYSYREKYEGFSQFSRACGANLSCLLSGHGGLLAVSPIRAYAQCHDRALRRADRLAPAPGLISESLGLLAPRGHMVGLGRVLSLCLFSVITCPQGAALARAIPGLLGMRIARELVDPEPQSRCVRRPAFAVFSSTSIYSLPKFALGASLAELHRRGFRGTGLAPVLLLAALGDAGQYNERFAGLNFVTLPLIAFTLLFAARHRRGEGFARVFINRLAVYLGDISYAFFIFQIPLVLALEHYVTGARTVLVWFLFGSMLALNLAIAAVSHHWLEPWGRRWVLQQWRVPQL